MQIITLYKISNGMNLKRTLNWKLKNTITTLFCVILFEIIWFSAYCNDREKELNAISAEAGFLSGFEKDLLFEINLFRTDPAGYARNHIQPLRKNFNNKYLNYPGDLPLLTVEGARAVDECVNELIKASPLTVVKPSLGLTKAARDHVRDQSVSGKTGHTGRDGSGFRKRIERYGKWNVRIAENIAYGGISARQVLVYLLIDDGIPGRGHRKNFLNPDFRLVGVAEGTHPEYKRMSVMDFAGSFE
jgi:hypothetical protein